MKTTSEAAALLCFVAAFLTISVFECKGQYLNFSLASAKLSETKYTGWYVWSWYGCTAAESGSNSRTSGSSESECCVQGKGLER